MTRPRELAACTVLVVVSLIAALAVLEVASHFINGVHWLLRTPNVAHSPYSSVIHDPQLGFVYKPNSVAPDASFDAGGFRATAASTPTNPGLVVATGDSFAFGLEVADDEAWPAILQELTGVRVINAGVGGYGLDQTVLRTERLAAELAPTAMVVSFIADDVWRAEMRRLWGAEKPYFTLGDDGELALHNVPVPWQTALSPDDASLMRRLIGWSALAQFVMRRLGAYGNWTRWHEELFGDMVRATPTGTGEKVACALMHRLARAGVPILVVAQYEPYIWTRGLAYQAEHRRQSRAVLECASAAGLATLDTLDMLNVAVARGGLQSLYLEEHHTALGNRLVAQSIADALAAHRMLAVSTQRP